MSKKQSPQDTQGLIANDPAGPALSLNANPADVRAAWRASFQEEARPRAGLWPWLWGVLSGLAAALLIGAVVLFVPPARNTVSSVLMRSVLILAFQGASPVELTAGGVFGSPITVILQDGMGKPVADTVVNFRIQPGEGSPNVKVAPDVRRTDASGQATVTLTGGVTPGKAMLIASAGQKEIFLPVEVSAATPTATLTPPITPTPTVTPTMPTLPHPVVVALSFEPPSLDLGQVTGPVSITVTAQDTDGIGAVGQMITLTVSGSGTVSPELVESGPDGKALFSYLPAELKQAGTITATTGTVTGTLELLAAPTEPTKIIVEPTTLDFGVGYKAVVTITLTTADAGAPVTNAPVTLSVQPHGLATISGKATYQGTTDTSNGRMIVELLCDSKVQIGKLVVTLADGTTAETTLTVRPVAHNKVQPNAILYRAPSKDLVDKVREAKPDERFPIVGKAMVKGIEWYQIRLPDGSTAWTVADKNNVETVGDTKTVEAVPVPTPTPKPTALPLPTATAPAGPTAAPTRQADYPPVGKYAVIVPAGQSGAPLSRIDNSTIQFAELGSAGSMVEVEAPPAAQEVPAAYVRVKVQFWVKKERVQDATLSVSNETGQACWAVQDVNGVISPTNTCGTLFPSNSPYRVGENPLPERGDWRQVTVEAWMPRENIGASRP